MSEMALIPLAPAIAAAIHDATGAWLTQQPMTPERVLAALSDSNTLVNAGCPLGAAKTQR
jgi:hypothetical protein